MAKKQRGWRGLIPFVADRQPNEWDIQNGRTEVIKGGQLGHGDESTANYYAKEEGRDVTVPNRWGEYWRDNFVFEDTLTFDYAHRGRSAATFQFRRSDGSHVEFFMQELCRLFPYFKDGKVTGRFTFVKRGANYSCSIIDPSESE